MQRKFLLTEMVNEFISDFDKLLADKIDSKMTSSVKIAKIVHYVLTSRIF